MHHKDMPTNNIKENQEVTSQSTNNREIKYKTKADFISKKELLQSPYSKLMIIDGVPDRLIVQKVLKKSNTTLYIFYNKENNTLTAYWPENNNFRLKTISVGELPLEKESDDPALINKFARAFGRNVGSQQHGKFSHRIALFNKKPSTNEEVSQKFEYNWYMKYEQSNSAIQFPKKGTITEENRKKGQNLLTTSFREVIAQEICRLIIPEHPKTRLIPHETQNLVFVASKEIPGFKSLDHLVNSNKQISQYKGLGSVCVLAVFVNEIDFKLTNICINQTGTILKIDGGWCYTKLKLSEYAEGNQYIKSFNKNFNELNFDVTLETLENLPCLPMNYTVWNWLDLIEEGKRKPTSLLLKELESKETYDNFQREANLAKLKISLLSEQLIKDFISVYHQIVIHFAGKFEDFYDLNKLNAEKDLLLIEIINRKEATKACALQQDSFKYFLQEEQTNRLITDYARELKNFRTMQNLPLNIDIDKMLDQEFNDLRLFRSSIKLN